MSLDLDRIVDEEVAFCRAAIEAAAIEGDSSLTAAQSAYRFDPAAYIRDKLGWTPWNGTDDAPGQQQILDAYTLALRQQHERDGFEQGALTAEQLTCWQPGQIIQNVIRVESGHTNGKTKILDGIINHFFDNFAPCVGYCFAPSWEQIHDLLFKEIKADRRGKGLPGRILDLELRVNDDHFVKGRATNNSQTEGVQGQHGRYNIYVLDEAEGVADFVFDAIRSMTSGGISIVLLAANPRTRSSRFHKLAAEPHVKSFRMSCLHHPNVVAGREIVPGAVRRQYVEEMIAAHCEVVAVHDADQYTFTVPWRADVIYQPDAEFMFRVLGIAPANVGDKTLIPVGRFEAACKRQPVSDRPHVAYMGVDVARFGTDFGTLYVRHDGAVWRARRFAQLDSVAYRGGIKEEAQKLRAKGVRSLHLRIDGGGGFGSGIIDNIRGDLVDKDGKPFFAELKTHEVHFGGEVNDPKAFDQWITEAMADVAESLKSLAVIKPPNELQADLTERQYEWVNKAGVAVKRVEPKERFRKRQTPERSPDDGDGFVLAAASEFLFYSAPTVPPVSLSQKSKWNVGG